MLDAFDAVPNTFPELRSGRLIQLKVRGQDYVGFRGSGFRVLSRFFNSIVLVRACNALHAFPTFAETLVNPNLPSTCTHTHTPNLLLGQNFFHQIFQQNLSRTKLLLNLPRSVFPPTSPVSGQLDEEEPIQAVSFTVPQLAFLGFWRSVGTCRP